MDAVSQYLEKHEVKWQKLAGFYTDGATTMLGFRSALIKTKFNPLLYFQNAWTLS